MSFLFTLQSRTSTLSANFYPPIQLDPNYNYSIALVGFYCYNSIPNIEEGVNNKFYYDNGKTINIPTGTYEITDIENYLQNQLVTEKNSSKQVKDDVISIKPNNNTLKCEVRSKYDIDFGPNDSLADLLGFKHKKIDKSHLHKSDNAVDIIKVTTIRIECNIARGCYYDGLPSHTIIEFAPGVEPGYLINVEPTNHIYLPIINKSFIDNITINVVDQNSNLVNFRNENIIVRLELKKDGLSF